MALTRAKLKAMDLDEEKVNSIIEMHVETMDALKSQLNAAEEQAEKVPALEKKVQELEAAKSTEDWEAKYISEHEAYEAFKAKVASEKADAEKSQLYRSMLAEQGIDPKRIDSIMRVTDLSGVEVKDGKLDNADELAAKAAEEWKDFVVKEVTKGAQVENPPAGGAAKTRDEILAIKDTAERQAAIAENPELFGLA